MFVSVGNRWSTFFSVPHPRLELAAVAYCCCVVSNRLLLINGSLMIYFDVFYKIFDTSHVSFEMLVNFVTDVFYHIQSLYTLNTVATGLNYLIPSIIVFD